MKSMELKKILVVETITEQAASSKIVERERKALERGRQTRLIV